MGRGWRASEGGNSRAFLHADEAGGQGGGEAATCEHEAYMMDKLAMYRMDKLTGIIIKYGIQVIFVPLAISIRCELVWLVLRCAEKTVVICLCLVLVELVE